MKLTISKYDIQIQLKQNNKNVIVVENESLLRNLILDLNKANEGKDEEIILSEDDKILKVNECMEILFSPFYIEINTKKVINKLYANLKEKAYDEKHYEKTMKLQSDILNYLYDLDNDTEYILTINDMDIVGILKSFAIEIEEPGEMLEQLDSYIKIISRLLKIKILVLINFSQYFSSKEISMIQKASFYEDIVLIFIESRDNIESNNKIIIDKDQCRVL